MAFLLPNFSISFTVVEMDGRRVARVKIRRLRVPGEEMGAGTADVQLSAPRNAEAAEPGDEAGSPSRPIRRTG